MRTQYILIVHTDAASTNYRSSIMTERVGGGVGGVGVGGGERRDGGDREDKGRKE